MNVIRAIGASRAAANAQSSAILRPAFWRRFPALGDLALHRWGRPHRPAPGILVLELDHERALELEETLEASQLYAQSVESLESAELAAWNNRFEAVIVSVGPTISNLQPVFAWLMREYGEARQPLVVAIVDESGEPVDLGAIRGGEGLVVRRSAGLPSLVETMKRALAARRRAARWS